MSAESPVDENSDLVTITLMVNGQEAESTYQVFKVEVVKKINRIASATITILDGDPASGDFPGSDSKTFIPGTEIIVKAGYHSTESILFSGIIVKHAIHLKKGRSPMLVLDCKDKAVKMTIGRNNAAFENMTDSNVIGQLISKYGLSKKVTSTSYTNKKLVQYYSTDWDFMVARAEANSMVVITDQGTVTVMQPSSSTSPVLELTYGETLFDFEVDADARTQYTKVQSTVWNPKQQATLQVTAQEPGITTPGNLAYSDLNKVSSPAIFNLQSGVPLEQADAQNWANASLFKSRFSKINGKVRFQGNADVLPGNVVQLAGMGSRFNGNALVSSVTHDIADGHWSTTVHVGLAPEWFTETQEDIVAPTAAGLLPGIQGMQTGIVVQTDEDPDKEFRVLVKIPLLDNQTVWARLANFYATSAAGSYFYPEVNDEVLLGFFNNDPRFPVIMGSLYSSQRAPAYTPDKDNTYKAIVSNSKVKIEIDDKKKIITVTTPGNNTIVLSDDAKSITLTDQNSNKIEMSSSGILIQSNSDITIKANQNVQMTANMNITATATSDLKLSGLNVTGTANAQMKMAGTATAEFSASGIVTVKGAMVKIN